MAVQKVAYKGRTPRESRQEAFGEAQTSQEAMQEVADVNRTPGEVASSGEEAELRSCQAGQAEELWRSPAEQALAEKLRVL